MAQVFGAKIYPRARRTLIFTIMILLLAPCALAIFPAVAQGAGASGKVVVLVVDRIGPRDITSESAPFLTDLANRWSAGMMMTRTAERANGKEPDLGAEYVTLAAGVRAKGSQSAALSFEVDEIFAGGDGSTTAGSYFLQSAGVKLPRDGVACLGMPLIRSASKGTGTEKNLGLLADQLTRAGKTAAVAGNEDSFSQPERLSALIACDPRGVVGLGKVADMTLKAPRQPGGLVTDFALLASESQRLMSRSDVLVIDTGDTGRVDRDSAGTGAEVLERARVRALRRVDDFAARLVGSLDLNSSLLLVVAPGAPMLSRLDGDYATPFIAAGKGFSKGLLSSGSTRRPGFVNNTDFLVTVLDFFGRGAPSQVTGAAMETAREAPGGRTNLEYIGELDRQYVVTRSARWPVVLGYLVCLGVFLLLALACIPTMSSRLKIEHLRERLIKVLRPLSVVFLAMPVSFLLVSAFSFDGWLFPLVFCVIYALVVGLGAYFLARKNKRMEPVTLVCLFSASVLLVDLLFGGRLLIFPLLGSSSQDGMRFFGMSNAVSGMLIAYVLWGLIGLGGEAATRRGPARWGIFLGFALVAFALGFGGLGGDFGGFIAVTATALVLFFATTEKGISGPRIAAIVALTAIATAVIVGADALFVHTHAGHALAAGSSQFLPLVGRKALTLLSQIKSILVLALLMIASVIAFSLWMKRPDSVWKQRWASDRAWTAALFSLLIGSIVALLLNDTGIGMMGTMVMITIPLAFYHLTDHQPSSQA